MTGVFTTLFWTPEAMVWGFVTSSLAAEAAGSVSLASVFWKQEVSDRHCSGDGTHVEDLKNLVQVQLPGGNLFLVVLYTETSRNHISISLLDNIPFDLCHNPGVRQKASLIGYSKCALPV